MKTNNENWIFVYKTATKKQITQLTKGKTGFQTLLEQLYTHRNSEINQEIAGVIVRTCYSQKIDITAFDSINYPHTLKKIENPPIVLYSRGIPTMDSEPTVAIVGSRKASKFALDYSYNLARRFSENGVTVISGMALGIDRAAHDGALSVDARTITILGESINYKKRKKENKDYIRNILKLGGWVLSEVPAIESYGPRAFNLANRNRITVGLADAVIVIECEDKKHEGKKSGTQHTIDFALAQNKPIYVPDTSIGKFNTAKYLSELSKHSRVEVINTKNGPDVLEQIINKNFLK
ncbi:hypothetical protein GF358_03180 [Candidatus Woesearchaeota archaeon]|nr:hypothetical protein [Candidatus Woesearchaeota archaeon]